MGRRLSYLVLKDRAARAEKREDFKRQARISAPKPYQKAPKRIDGYYNSYLRDGALFQVTVIVPNLNFLANGTPGDTNPAAGDFTKVGLFATPPAPAGRTPTTIKGTGAKPAMLKWYKGLETPIAGRTAWDTPSRKWGDKTGGANGQSHRSCPVGDLSSPVTFEGINTLVVALVAPIRIQLLGATGQITLLPEVGNIQL